MNYGKGLTAELMLWKFYYRNSFSMFSKDLFLLSLNRKYFKVLKCLQHDASIEARANSHSIIELIYFMISSKAALGWWARKMKPFVLLPSAINDDLMIRFPTEFVLLWENLLLRWPELPSRLYSLSVCHIKLFFSFLCFKYDIFNAHFLRGMENFLNFFKKGKKWSKFTRIFKKLKFL